MVLNTTKVYNFTPFVTMHPAAARWCPIGGRRRSRLCQCHHSSNAVALEALICIGALVAAPAPITVTLTPSNATIKSAQGEFTPTVVGSTQRRLDVAPSRLVDRASGLFTGVVAGQAQ